MQAPRLLPLTRNRWPAHDRLLAELDRLLGLPAAPVPPAPAPITGPIERFDPQAEAARRRGDPGWARRVAEMIRPLWAVCGA